MPTTPVLPRHLRADCSACDGICCVALPFDADQGFGFDKPAHTRCPHLADNACCRIHASRRQRGFGGCEAFDCHGAGQRLHTALGPGAIDAERVALFGHLLRLQRWLATLWLLRGLLPLEAQRQHIDRLCARLDAVALDLPQGVSSQRMQQAETEAAQCVQQFRRWPPGRRQRGDAGPSC